MLLIRHFEERVKYLFLEGVMPGTIHQYQGQEAIAVGVCAALEPADVITSTHRPHGHAIAKGLTVESLMHELFGKPTGCCRGKGGSMHVGDPAKGMIPAIAIVGGGVPVATGMALAFRMKKEPRVAVCFMGDGAVNEGAFHEASTWSIWLLPVVYASRNNRYSASTPIAETVRLKNMADRAAGYGSRRHRGRQHVMAVYETDRAAIGQAPLWGRADAGGGRDYRITGHSRATPATTTGGDARRRLAAEPIGACCESAGGRRRGSGGAGPHPRGGGRGDRARSPIGHGGSGRGPEDDWRLCMPKLTIAEALRAGCRRDGPDKRVSASAWTLASRVVGRRVPVSLGWRRSPRAHDRTRFRRTASSAWRWSG
jgi:pyruvate dehydrogenase E1 component alpha subunit